MRRQHEFLALLDQRHDAHFAERLRDWLLDWNAGRSPQIDARLTEYRQARDKMLLSVFAQLRPDQQREVAERLRWYIDALHDLSSHSVRQRAQAATAPFPSARP